MREKSTTLRTRYAPLPLTYYLLVKHCHRWPDSDAVDTCHRSTLAEVLDRRGNVLLHYNLDFEAEDGASFTDRNNSNNDEDEDVVVVVRARII